MATIFISDNGPDAEEYESNYINFNGSDPSVVREIENIFSTQNVHDPVVRNRLELICKESLMSRKSGPKRGRFSSLKQNISRFKGLFFGGSKRERIHNPACFVV